MIAVADAALRRKNRVDDDLAPAPP